MSGSDSTPKAALRVGRGGFISGPATRRLDPVGAHLQLPRGTNLRWLAFVSIVVGVGRRFTGVVVGLVALFAVGVIDGSAAAPTKSSWARAANAICTKGNAEIRALPALSSAAVLISDLTKAEQIEVSEDAKFARLEAPSSERATVAALLANDRSSETLIVKQLVPALKRGDSSSASTFNAKGQRLSDAYNALARKLGATVCALNSTPGG